MVDLCPVGSLLSKDFLHKARAWDLDKTASVCPGCTQGCNINIDTRDDVVVRIRPRPNLEVNRHFICDYGRMSYRWMNRGDRIEAPLVRDGGRHVATDWDTALARLDQMLRGATGLGGDPRVGPGLAPSRSAWSGGWSTGSRSRPRCRCRWVTRRRSPGFRTWRSGASGRPTWPAPSCSATSPHWEAAMRQVLLGGRRHRARRRPQRGRRGGARRGARAGRRARHRRRPTSLRNAELVLPVTTMAEENGTYVNRDRRVQRYQQARSQPGMARPAWWVAGEVLAGPGPSADAPSTGGRSVRRCSGERWPVFAGLTHADLGFTGRVLGRDRPRPKRAERRRPVTPELKGFILLSVVKMLLVFTVIMVGVALLTLMERKVSAWMQNRRGPNRVGWAGLLQPAADGVKNILKEETYPAARQPRGSSCWRRRCRSSRRCSSRR